MDESVIRGLVMGGMLGIAGLVATLIWRMIRAVESSDEGSRRVKLVALWGFALGYVAMAVSIPEATGLMLGLAALIGVVYWVRAGMKK